MTCPLCGGTACTGHVSNHVIPVGYGWFGPESGPPVGVNRGAPQVYERADGMWISTERLYLTKDGRVVRGDDPEKASLLVGVGGKLPMETARRYGLVEQDAKAVTKSPANKAIGKAPANKAAKE